MSDSCKTFSVVGDRYRIIVSGEQSHGAFAMVDALVPPQSGSPPHVHHHEDEAFYILEGLFEFNVNGKIFRLGPGKSLYAVRDVPHFFKCVSETAGRMIFTVTPAGLEKFFEEIGTLLPSPDSPSIPPTHDDIERLLAAAPRYGLEIFLAAP